MARTREIALQFGDPARTGRGGLHYQEGDVVVERAPLGRIGAKEATSFVWLLVEIPDDIEPLEAYLDAQDQVIAKARFVFPVGRLRALAARFDLSRARDPEDIYQPFLPVTQTPAGDFVFGAPRLRPHLRGHLHDKRQGRTR